MVRAALIIVLAVVLFLSTLTESYVIHKSRLGSSGGGGLRKRTIDDWRNAFFYRELRQPGMDMDTDVLAEMDALVRPRFG